ncbi:MAG: esterase, partial [Bacteroidales bacterium]|nr:esterase [Bacteroidales bacterium]
MKTPKIIFAALLTAAICGSVAAQDYVFPEGTYSPVTNVNRNSFPRVLKDNSVIFRVDVPHALMVEVDVCGTKYRMQKMENGSWTATTQPLVPGFHYYSIIVDGSSLADPASQTFFGCSRWSSAIEIVEPGMDDFEVQDVPHGEVRTVNYYSKV